MDRRLPRQDFALNLLAKRRLCNTVGGGIGRTVEDCVVSAARSRAATTTNLARSSQALVLSALFMICPQWFGLVASRRTNCAPDSTAILWHDRNAPLNSAIAEQSGFMSTRRPPACANVSQYRCPH